MLPTERDPAADYDAAALRRALAPAGYRRVAVLPEVASTNDWLTEQLRTGYPAPAWTETAQPTDPAHGTVPGPDHGLSVVVTGHQSAGRGRLDRGWLTPPGTAVTFSVGGTLRTPAGTAWPTELLPWATLVLAHAVVDALRATAALPAVLKWPNDVLVADRKICGVLATVLSVPGRDPAVIVGAGINVHQRHLPVPTATSVRLQTGDDAVVPDRAELLTDVLTRYAATLRELGEHPAAGLGAAGALRKKIEAQLDTLGRDVVLHLPGAHAQRVVARAVGLGRHGELVVRDAHGHTREVSAGDVVHVRAVPAADDAAAALTPAQRRAHEAVRTIAAEGAR